MTIINNNIQSNDIYSMPGILRKMRMSSMAKALEEKLSSPNCNLFAVQSELSEIILAEFNTRRANKVNKLIKDAGLKMPDADIEDLYTECGRSMNMDILNQMLRCDWIKEKKNLIITGKAGTGKTNIACALGGCAIQRGMSVFYVKASLMINDLCEYQLTGDYKDYLKTYTDPKLLIIDDFGLMSLDISRCLHLFEVLDAREGEGSILVISQIPVAKWYDTFQNSVYADACMSRLTHNSYRLEMNGKDMRRSS